MAIVFTKQKPTEEIVGVYNNAIFEFSSDIAKTAKKCEVIFYDPYTFYVRNIFEITPINEVFRFDIKPIIKNYINLPVENEYDYTQQKHIDESLYIDFLFAFNIIFTDNTSDGYALNNTITRQLYQIGDNDRLSIYEQHFFVNENLKAFVGYPFDYSYFTSVDGDYTITNETNGEVDSFNLTDVYEVYRIRHEAIVNEYERRVLADGGTYEDNSCYNKKAYNFLDVGLNVLKHTDDQTAIAPLVPTTKYLYLTLEDKCGGVYLRWINNKGGYSYWLFNPVYRSNVNSKTNDIYYVQSENLQDTTQNKSITGKKSENTLNFKEMNLDVNDFSQIISIIDSDKIEMYNGERFETETSNSWQSVILKDGSFQVENTKRSLRDISFTIEVNRYSRY